MGVGINFIENHNRFVTCFDIQRLVHRCNDLQIQDVKYQLHANPPLNHQRTLKESTSCGR
jgi:hypothetical protein